MRAGCICCALLLAAPALAEPDSTASGDHQWRRELAGHVFFPSLAVPDPFLSTHFEILTGAGYAWIDGPGFDVRGNLVGTAEYKAGALSETLAFQASLTQWLAVRLSGDGGVNAGFNASSALVIGAVQPIGITAGATASWQIGRFVRLGGLFDFVYTYLKLIQPLDAVRNSFIAARADDAGVSQKINGFSVLPGGAVAIAPHPAIGLQGSAQYSWVGFPNRDLSYFVLGVSAQVDFRLISARAPVGILLSYRTQIPFQSDTRFTHTLETGLFYTGRRAIDLGLDLQARWFDLRPDTTRPLDTVQLLAFFLLRYHWN
jgi:hypothetical protein